MRWDGFFADLEDQFSSEWEAERSSVDSETERLRVSRLALRERLAVLVGSRGGARHPSFDLVDGTTLAAEVTIVGADWVALDTDDSRTGTALVPIGSLVSIGMPARDLERSVRPARASGSDLSSRMTFGFVMRDLGRRRSGIAVNLVHGRSLTGTIDRAGADHLDLALHDPGAPRRTAEVLGHRAIPFPAIAWVRLDPRDRV